MKKIIILILPIILASCFWPNKAEVQKAKDELLNNTQTTTSEDKTKNETQKEEIIQKSYFKINYVTDNKSIDIEPIKDIESIKDVIDIKWIVFNKEIDKIKVIFENKTSTFPVDNYELKTYKKWSENFLYRAYRKYSVLDLWLNEYTFEWYVWENLVSSVKLELFIADPNKISNIKTEGKLLNETWSINAFTWDILTNLPTEENTYWTPSTNTDEQTFTYSNLANFIWTKNSDLQEVNCENFANYLSENYTWYYWNTCRPIEWENNFSVNVLFLTWDEYRYEKHYISGKYWIYWKILLESWSWISQDDLQAKNDELKAKTFDTNTNSDKLFKDLLR